MANDEWYRNTNWNEGIKETFFAKLGRARSQRDQYLVIQALTLAPRFPEATLELIETYFATRADNFDDARACLARAKAYSVLGQLPELIKAYKDVLAREVKFPNFKTRAYVELPYLVASEGVSSEYDFALSTLAERVNDIAFPIDRFMWHAASALIAFDQGRSGDAVDHAKEAVKAAKEEQSGFRYHQKLGLVGKEHQKVLKKNSLRLRRNRGSDCDRNRLLMYVAAERRLRVRSG